MGASRLGGDPQIRQIQEEGVLRSLDPESESENEVVLNPCEAERVGLILQGRQHALAPEGCQDRASQDPTRLLDLGGRDVASLCDHHSQLYMLACQGRKCSVLSCFATAKGARNGAPFCKKHLTEATRSPSPKGPSTPNRKSSDNSLSSALRAAASRQSGDVQHSRDDFIDRRVYFSDEPTSAPDGAQRAPPRKRTSTPEVRGRWLVRIHNKPRLALFVPSKARGLPVPEEQLDGERRTVVRAAGNEQTILDDYRNDENPGRCLIDRWTGETYLKISANHPQGQVPDSEAKPPEPQEELPECAPFDPGRGRPRQRQPPKEPAESAPSDPGRQRAVDTGTSTGARGSNEPAEMEVPRLVPATPADDLPGKLVPGTPRSAPMVADTSECPVPDCCLPGGHELPHRDVGGNRFAYDKRTDTKLPLEDSGDETEEISSSGSELEPDVDGEPESKRRRRRPPVPEAPAAGDSVFGYVFEIEMESKDWRELISKPKRANVWMAKRLSKGTEANWRELSMAQKYDFDEAQAKEIDNVLRNEAEVADKVREGDCQGVRGDADEVGAHGQERWPFKSTPRCVGVPSSEPGIYTIGITHLVQTGQDDAVVGDRQQWLDSGVS